jgi:hypothetical protein
MHAMREFVVNAKMQNKIGQSSNPMHLDAAAYLAAILPELSEIAKTSHLDKLSRQINRAAILAQKALVQADTVKPSRR